MKIYSICMIGMYRSQTEERSKDNQKNIENCYEHRRLYIILFHTNHKPKYYTIYK